MPPFFSRAFAAAALLTGFAFPGSVLSAPPGDKPAQTKAASGADRLFTEFTPETFRASERARRPVDADKPDYDALSAAIFHETNRRRAREKLPPLRHLAEARRAAQTQAEIMAETKTLTHVNKGKRDRRTLMDRLRLAGARPSFAAENIATAFALNYQAGEAVYTREEKGRKIFSLRPGGEPLKTHTALSFAEALLDSWMKSPAHRKNILSKNPDWLGAGLRPATGGDNGMPVFYCAQVFCATSQEE